MSALSCADGAVAPRSSSLVVSSANQRSTRLIQLLEVGVKCRTNRGCWASQRSDLRGLVAGGVVEHEVHVEVLGDVRVDRLEELEELDRAVALVQLSRSPRRSGCSARRRGWWCRCARSRGSRARACRAASAGSARSGPALGSGSSHRRQDHGPLGRVQVQAADVVDLLDELRVLGELEASPGGGVAARTRARSASPRPA